jgi:hypothetical protein
MWCLMFVPEGVSSKSNRRSENSSSRVRLLYSNLDSQANSQTDIVAYLLKACTVEPEKQSLLAKGSDRTFVSMQQILYKQQMNRNRGTVFYVRSVPRCYNRDGLQQRVQCSVESRAVKRRLEGWCEMAASLGASRSKVRL